MVAVDIRFPGKWMRVSLVLVCLVALAGCGGGGGDDPATATGLPVTHTTAAELQERQAVFAAINGQRASAGLAQLVMRDDLNAVAQAHAEDMSLRGYTAHVSPEGKDVDDRLGAIAASYNISGENIARNQSSALTVQAWLNSPEHREGIFLPDYRLTGIGVSQIDPNQPPWNNYQLNGTWWHFVQVFTD